MNSAPKLNGIVIDENSLETLARYFYQLDTWTEYNLVAPDPSPPNGFNIDCPLLDAYSQEIDMLRALCLNLYQSCPTKTMDGLYSGDLTDLVVAIDTIVNHVSKNYDLFLRPRAE